MWLSRSTLEKCIEQHAPGWQVLKHDRTDRASSSAAANKEKEEDWTASLFVPRCHDGLFWCFFMMWEGKDAFFELSHRHRLAEMQWKSRYLPMVERRSADWKGKVGESVASVLQCIDSEPRLSIPAFVALCLSHDISILLVMRTRACVLYGEDPMFLVREDPRHPGRFGWMSWSPKLELPPPHHVLVTDWQRPVKPISSYTKEQLVHQCTQLGLKHCTASSSKAFLYDAFVRALT